MRPRTISPGLWPTAPFTDPLVQPLTRTGAGPLWSLSSASPRQLLLLPTQFWHISILQAHSELSPALDSSSFAIQNVHKAMLGTYYFLPCVIIIFEQVHFFSDLFISFLKIFIHQCFLSLYSDTRHSSRSWGHHSEQGRATCSHGFSSLRSMIREKQRR